MHMQNIFTTYREKDEKKPEQKSNVCIVIKSLTNRQFKEKHCTIIIRWQKH